MYRVWGEREEKEKGKGQEVDKGREGGCGW
jgi:hypothetical protein